METEERSWFKKFFPTWFTEDNEQAQASPPGSSSSLAGRAKATAAGRSVAPAESKQAAAVAKRMTMLKTALQFDSNVASQLSGIQTPQQLILFIHEVLVYKFVRLGELGILDEKSSQVLGLVSKKLEAALLEPDQKAEEGSDPVELARENELLRKQLDSLRAEHVKTGIVSERELQLDDECTYLKRRIRELNSLLHISKKRVARLTSSQEQMESVMARNSLLNSKVEHQAKLLRILAADKPEQQLLVAQMDNLQEENKHLKEQLETQFSMLEQLPEHAVADSPLGDDMKSLLAETTGLISEFHDKQDRLETLTTEQPESNLLESLDRLQEDNVHLKNLLKNKEKLDSLLQHTDRGGEQQAQLATFVREGNERMKEVLAAKNEQFKVFRQGAEFRPLVRALFNTKKTNRDLKRENRLKQSVCENLQRDKLLLQRQVQNLSACQKKSKQLEARLSSCERQLQAMRPIESRYKELKKEVSLMRIQQERTDYEKQQIEQKLQRLNVEYKFLVSEYERLFSNM